MRIIPLFLYLSSFTPTLMLSSGTLQYFFKSIISLNLPPNPFRLQGRCGAWFKVSRCSMVELTPNLI